LAEIAWQKAGIMKPGVPCVVSFDIGGEAIRVIEERAVEKQVFQRIIFE
jgi:folylpolyglutamate synthase/dihydropteroate synthase